MIVKFQKNEIDIPLDTCGFSIHRVCDLLQNIYVYKNPHSMNGIFIIGI